MKNTMTGTHADAAPFVRCEEGTRLYDLWVEAMEDEQPALGIEFSEYRQHVSTCEICTKVME